MTDASRGRTGKFHKDKAPSLGIGSGWQETCSGFFFGKTMNDRSERKSGSLIYTSGMQAWKVRKNYPTVRKDRKSKRSNSKRK